MLTAGQTLQWIVISLLCIAVIMVHSAGMSISGEPATIDSLLYGRPTLYAVAAIAVMWVLSWVDVRSFDARLGMWNPIVWMTVVSIGLCVAALVPGLGRNVNGASRWLSLGPASWGLSFQPSELAKWVMIAAMAWWGARHAGSMKKFFSGLAPPLMLLGFVMGLVVIEDLGTALLIGVVGTIVLIAAGARIWQFMLLLPGACAVLWYMIASEPYRVQRLTAFLDPWADPNGVGYHPIQSMVAIAGGQITGRGLGNGLQKFGYLPEDTTDFLFAIICEELGIAGACLVVGLYLLLLLTGLGIVRDCRRPFCRLLGLGVLATIGIQAVMNIAVVTVVVPTKGIALPLLSSGGTGWVMCAGAVGLLVAIDRINRLDAEEAADEIDAMVARPALV